MADPPRPRLPHRRDSPPRGRPPRRHRLRLSPATIRTFDQELTAIVERGFTPALALHTITAISRYVTGFVLQEQRTRMMSDGTAILRARGTFVLSDGVTCRLASSNAKEPVL
ncbi:TetR/AcrR family transcriptional regulator C-terminal domain-containing protein [Streptosporangiaceae bacterium NEAU-GS5]|nr:TetR/AcrR family transcriptional regulator C-terminal domain-containing protein [Streptosporangiaceae bacterium NEAU-GS5]